jgi:putative addiction module component (TIGR02574 family)
MLQFRDMPPAILKSALKLSKAERILLAERLWDSVAEQDAPLKLTRGQQRELDRRLKRLDKTGPKGSSWVTVKARITRRRRQGNGT